MKKILVIVAFAAFLFASCTGPLADAPKVYNRAIAEDTGKPSLLLVGDSRVQEFPEELLSEYFDVTNIGVGGTTSGYSAFAIQAQTRRYDYIIISVGINDMAGGYTMTQSVHTIAACVAQAKLKSSHVFVTTIPGIDPCPTFPLAVATNYSARADQINGFIPTVAQNYFIHWIDLADALNYGIYLDAQYADSTGIHYNAAGYDIIAEMYLRVLGVVE